jgi:REP element-mobilizing transposase RayT
VYARGNDQQAIFRHDGDRRIYLRLLGTVTVRRRWRCLSYCLMDNHVHLLLETPGGNLGAGMQQLQGNYAQSHNVRHRRSGHLFQGRYGAVRVTTDAQLWATAAYIARNPVDAGLCDRPEEYRWSSHGAWAEEREPVWLDRARLRWYLGGLSAPAPQRVAQA